MVITLSEIDSPSCKTEKAACPDIEDLTRIGDKVIDGKVSFLTKYEKLIYLGIQEFMEHLKFSYN